MDPAQGEQNEKKPSRRERRKRNQEKHAEENDAGRGRTKRTRYEDVASRLERMEKHFGIEQDDEEKDPWYRYGKKSKKIYNVRGNTKFEPKKADDWQMHRMLVHTAIQPIKVKLPDGNTAAIEMSDGDKDSIAEQLAYPAHALCTALTGDGEEASIVVDSMMAIGTIFTKYFGLAKIARQAAKQGAEGLPIEESNG